MVLGIFLAHRIDSYIIYRVSLWLLDADFCKINNVLYMNIECT